MKRLLQSAALVGVFVLFSFAGQSLASGNDIADYWGNGKFLSNYISYTVSGDTSLFSGAHFAGMAQWTQDTDLVMQVSGVWQDIKFHGQNYGVTNWGGFAFRCNTSGQCSDAYLDGTYATCSVLINTWILENSYWSEKKNLFMHEAGHCYSLGHQAGTDNVMHGYIDGTTIPSTHERNLINNRY